MPSSPGPPPEPAPSPNSAPQRFGEHRPLSYADRGLWLILACTLVLQLFTLSRVEGYQVADAVEYMDRANMAVQGRDFDPQTPRPFTFSALLAPLFWAAHRFELEGYGAVVALVRILQMAVGLLTIAVVGRLGSRIAGRAFGLVCAVFTGANVAFLRYTVSAVSEPEATLFVALALESLLLPRTRARGFATGLCLGASILFTYKTIPIVGALLLGILAYERLRNPRWLRATFGGLLGCILLTAAVDTKIYGNFGSSIGGYIFTNVASIGTRLVYELGFVELATWMGNTFLLQEGEPVRAEDTQIFQIDPQDYYYANAPEQFLSWPLLALLILGALASLRRPRYPTFLLLCVTLFNLYLLNSKGTKSFRLLLPLVPMISVLGAMGWRSLRGATAHAPGGSLLRSFLAAAVVFAGVVPLPGKILALDLKSYAGYWRAMDVVNDEARRARSRAEEEGAKPPPVVVGSAYHWAVTLRESRDVELRKLPTDPLNVTRGSEELRAKTLAALGRFDWFIGHLQLLTHPPRLVEVLNHHFQIESLLYDVRTYGELAPICILRRRSPAADPAAAPPRSFYELRRGQSPSAIDAYREGLQHPVGLLFEHRAPDGRRQVIELLGWEVETGLGSGDLVWVSYHWAARTDGVLDFTLHSRVTDWDGRTGLWGAPEHVPAYGVHPTSRWRTGDVLRESYARMLPPAAHEFGGAHRRADLVPVTLWIAFTQGAPGGPDFRRMEVLTGPGGPPARRYEPTVNERRNAFKWPSDGLLWDAEGRISVGGFWLPVPSDLRIPDDGRQVAGRL